MRSIKSFAMFMVIVMLIGMMVMNILQRIHNKRVARMMAESDERIHAARLAAEE